MNDGFNEPDPTPGPGWWMDDDGELRPPQGDPTVETAAAARTASASAPPMSAPPTTAPPTTMGPSGVPPTPDPPRVSPPDLPPAPTGDAFGSTFTWACRAMREHAGHLLLVGLTILVLYVATGIVMLVITVVATQIDVALVRAALTFLVIAVALAAAAWSWLLLSRSWFRIARGDGAHLDVANPTGFGPVAVALVLLSPIWLFTGPLAFGFAVTALVLVHEPLSGTGAVGRMLTEAFSSARRFLHTLLISLGVGAALAVLFAVVTWSSLIVTSSVASTTVQSWLDDGDDLFRDLDTSLTTVLGVGINALVAVLVSYAIISLGGLWVAGHVRRATGRRVGAAGAGTAGA